MPLPHIAPPHIPDEELAELEDEVAPPAPPAPPVLLVVLLVVLLTVVVVLVVVPLPPAPPLPITSPLAQAAKPATRPSDITNTVPRVVIVISSKKGPRGLRGARRRAHSRCLRQHPGCPCTRQPA
jgi:hypothetical protein